MGKHGQKAWQEMLDRIGERFDLVVMGHFHTAIETERFLVNASFKGGDEYSVNKVHAASRPSQTVCYVHPENGLVGVEHVYLDGEERVEPMEQSERLYNQYAKPLEQDHWGEYIAIAPDGRTVTGTDLVEVSNQALAQFGRGSFVFKVGEQAVGKWR